MEFTISNLITNINRKAKVSSFSFNDDTNIMNLSLKIVHYSEGKALHDMDKSVDVMVDNNNPIIPNSNGDFDYIYSMLSTTTIAAVLEMSVGLLDSLGVINAKCNYNVE